MKNIEGQLDINLYPQRNNGARVVLSSSRPVHAAKIFVGKSPEQVLTTIPLLYSICGIAQSRASLTAIEKNLKIDSTPELETARDMLVLVENAKEHLFRLFIDWPKLFGLKTSNSNLPYLSQLITEFKSILFENGEAFSLDSKLNSSLKYTDYLIVKLDQYLQQHVFCQPIEDWLKINNSKTLQHWAQQCDTVAANSIDIIYQQDWCSQGSAKCEPLPLFDETDLLKQFNAADAEKFIALPQWQGHCCETTTLTRQLKQPLIQALHQEYQAALITRWVARLVELANIPHQLRSMLQQLTEAETKTANTENKNNVHGLAQIEAARGRLVHHVNIEQGIISKYQILAPTEWNFHPQGLVAKSLGNLLSNTENKNLEKLAHLMINAIDPCVGYQLRVH